jgi:transcriptional regulator with XRE-family HTH domain
MKAIMKWYEKVKIIMEHKKIRQSDLINVFEVKTRGAVGHYLCGRREPSVDQLKRLCDRLGVDMDTITDNTETDLVKIRVKAVMRAAERAMRTVDHVFTEDEKLSVYRAAFSAGLEKEISEQKLMDYLKFITDK